MTVRGGVAWMVALAMTMTACGGGGEPAPVPGFGILSGKAVLVLPVQYVRPVPGGWVGGATNGRDAARAADSEIAFALAERSGRASWVLPARQRTVLARRPGIRVDPYALSADEVRDAGDGLQRIRDPLYGEIRALSALFGTRFVVWPLQVYYDRGDENSTGRLAIHTLLLDARTGEVLWQGDIYGRDGQAASPAALATAAQAFAAQVSP